MRILLKNHASYRALNDMTLLGVRMTIHASAKNPTIATIAIVSPDAPLTVPQILPINRVRRQRKWKC